jgi:hypothetical protein
LSKHFPDRHWKYQLWLRVSKFYPIFISEQAQKRKLSFVFSRDVANGILAVFSLGSTTFGEAFNLAAVRCNKIHSFSRNNTFFVVVVVDNHDDRENG